MSTLKVNNCNYCKKDYTSRGIKFCSRKCMGMANRGVKRPAWIGEKITKAKTGKPRPDMVGNIRTLGMKHTDETKRKLSLISKGKKLSDEQKKKLSKSHLGDKNPQWKGGITPTTKRIRQSAIYREWRTAVFKRDGYTCQNCKVTGVYLEAEHIKPFALFEELRLEVSNGLTLCKPCHLKIGAKVNRHSKREHFISREVICGI